MIASFEKNPAKGGTPASASEPMIAVTHVMGMNLARPPILRMSCSWCSAMITEPAHRNSSALKNACVVRWKIAAEYAETPSATVI